MDPFKPCQVPDYVTLRDTGAVRKRIFAGLRSITCLHPHISTGFWWKFSGRISSPDDDECILCTGSGVGFHPIRYNIPETIVVHISYKHRTIYKPCLLIYRFEI